MYIQTRSIFVAFLTTKVGKLILFIPYTVVIDAEECKV